MIPRPIGLSDSQLDNVLDAAEQVPHEWRSRFLDSVADLLMVETAIGDNDVLAAITAALVRIGVAP